MGTIVIHAEESLRLKKKDNRKLGVYENDCIRAIVGISLMNIVKIYDIQNIWNTEQS